MTDKPHCECGRDVVAKGMCMRHYDRERARKRRLRLSTNNLVRSPPRQNYALSTPEIARRLAAWAGPT